MNGTSQTFDKIYALNGIRNLCPGTACEVSSKSACGCVQTWLSCEVNGKNLTESQCASQSLSCLHGVTRFGFPKCKPVYIIGTKLRFLTVKRKCWNWTVVVSVHDWFENNDTCFFSECIIRMSSMCDKLSVYWIKRTWKRSYLWYCLFPCWNFAGHNSTLSSHHNLVFTKANGTSMQHTILIIQHYHHTTTWFLQKQMEHQCSTLYSQRAEQHCKAIPARLFWQIIHTGVIRITMQCAISNLNGPFASTFTW